MSSSDLCTRVHVKPAPDRKVRMPDRGFALMPPEGQEVQRNVSWSRRIAVGDVIESNPVNPTETPATKGAKPK